MTKFIPIFFLSLLVLPITSFADSQVITLKDGSQIKGELVNITAGIYTIKTASLGNVSVPVNNVANISNGPSPTTIVPDNQNSATATGTNPNQQIEDAQARVMANPEVMAELTQIAQDPEIMKLLSDPQLMQAASAKDANAISQNPNAQELMKNPRMRAIIEKIQASNN